MHWICIMSMMKLDGGYRFDSYVSQPNVDGCSSILLSLKALCEKSNLISLGGIIWMWDLSKGEVPIPTCVGIRRH